MHLFERLRRNKSHLVVVSAIPLLMTAAFVASAAQFDREAVINHLNAIIGWYRASTSNVQTNGLSSDAIYQDNAQNLAAEVVRLAFQSARAEATLDRTSNKTPSAAANGTNAASADQAAPQQDFSQMAANLTTQISANQAKLDALDKQLQSTGGSKRKSLQTQRDALQGGITLDKATLDVVQKMATFVESNNESVTEGLEGRINQLARTVPEVLSVLPANAPGAKAAATKPATATTVQPPPAGLVGQALALYGEMRSVRELDKLTEQTEAVRQTAIALRKPLRATLAATIQQGRQLASSQSASADGSPGPQGGTLQQLQDLTAQFKQLSTVVLPLSQEILILEQSKSNLQEWRRAIIRESKSAVTSLAMRVIAIAVALGFILGLGELWRRLTFRYIRDLRRRRQFLLLRRFVMGFLVVLVIILGFVSEFGSLATFAGFVTAGIAVGLQTVLLSVAAYFFVVGRYGIHVGDRISVAGVTGDVIDIGLVRMYLMELAGTGVDLFPTGRVVVFSNSVLFQATTPLFKQIPGTQYLWHEVVFALVPGADYSPLQEKVLSAVNSIYEKYRPRIERQHGDIEQRLEIQLKAPSPEGNLQFGDAGVEYAVRYPVEIRSESDMDGQVATKVLELINQVPEIKSAVSGSPKIRAAVKG